MAVQTGERFENHRVRSRPQRSARTIRYGPVMKVTPRYEGPALLTMDGAPDDQREPMVRQRRRFAAMLAELDDDQWRAPSRCAGWSVQDVVAHLVGVNAFWRASIAAGLGGAPTRVLVDFDPVGTPQLMIEPMRVLAPHAVLLQFVESNEALLEVVEGLDANGWTALAESPPGHLPIRLIAQHALWDAWIHERDVALPLGLATAVVPDEVGSCLRYAAALSPGFALSAGAAQPGTFAVDARDPECRFAVEVATSVAVTGESVPDGAPVLSGDAVALVEALSLRAPFPESAPAEWRALVGGLATVFAV
jgi:uncharacterized protein (TIGR03083 family)